MTELTFKMEPDCVTVEKGAMFSNDIVVIS